MTKGLTGLELEAFCQTASSGEITEAKLAERLNILLSSASRVVNSLMSKRFLTLVPKGVSKIASPAFSPAALKLIELIEANPHIEFESVLDGATLQALSGFIPGPASVHAASISSRTPEVTERRVVSRLLGRAVLQKAAYGKYAITLPRLKEFVEAWLLQEIERKRRREVPGSLIVRGPHGLLRSTKQDVPTYMTRTGLSVFHTYGVSLNFDFEDYYFHAFESKPAKLGLEEHLIHSLLRSTVLSSGREVSYALLVMLKNWTKFDEKKFLEYGLMLGVIGVARQSIDFIKGFNEGAPILFTGSGPVEGPVFPTRNGFLELVEQYEPRA